jgi:hypothetical protein
VQFNEIGRAHLLPFNERVRLFRRAAHAHSKVGGFLVVAVPVPMSPG